MLALQEWYEWTSHLMTGRCTRPFTGQYQVAGTRWHVGLIKWKFKKTHGVTADFNQLVVTISITVLFSFILLRHVAKCTIVEVTKLKIQLFIHHIYNILSVKYWPIMIWKTCRRSIEIDFYFIILCIRETDWNSWVFLRLKGNLKWRWTL